MSFKYTPTCCCQGDLIFVPGSYSVYKNTPVSIPGRPDTTYPVDQFLDIYLQVFSLKDASFVKLVKIDRIPAYSPTVARLHGRDLPSAVNYQPQYEITACSDSVVVVAYSLLLRIDKYQLTGSTETDEFGAYPIVVNEIINGVCFIDYSDFSILSNTRLEVDPTLVISHCCIDSDSVGYVGFKIKPSSNFYPNNDMETFFSYAKPSYGRPTPIVKIKWDGTILTQYDLSKDTHDIGYAINDLSVTKSGKVLVTVSSEIRAFRKRTVYTVCTTCRLVAGHARHTVPATPGYHTYVPSTTETRDYFYWKQSYLKVFPGGTQYCLTRSATSQPGFQPDVTPQCFGAAEDDDGVLHLGGFGYSAENIYPESFEDYPEDRDVTSLDIDYGNKNSGVNIFGAAPFEMVLGSGGAPIGSGYVPYHSIFKHNGGTSGTYTDWDMLVPRFYPMPSYWPSILSGFVELKFTNKGTLAVKAKTLVDLIGLGYTDQSSGIFLQVPIDPLHNQGVYDVNVPKLYRPLFVRANPMGALSNSLFQAIAGDRKFHILDNDKNVAIKSYSFGTREEWDAYVAPIIQTTQINNVQGEYYEAEILDLFQDYAFHVFVGTQELGTEYVATGLRHYYPLQYVEPSVSPGSTRAE